MKIVKIVFAVLAGLYCLAQIGLLGRTLLSEGGLMGISSAAASICFVILSGLLSFMLFRSALANPKAASDSSDSKA